MKMIFIVGHHGVGKTYLKQFYENRNDIYTFDAGPFLRSKKAEEEPNLSMQEWVDQLEKKLGYFATTDVMAEQIKKNVSSKKCKNLMIFGFRHLDCIEYLANKLCENDWRVIYLDANFELIKSNYETREKVLLSEKTFRKELEEEDKWGLKELREWVEENDKGVKLFKEKNDNSYKNYIDNMLEK